MRRSMGFIFLALLVTSPHNAWALANPASLFCAKGGVPDGRVVDEWAYFRAMK